MKSRRRLVILDICPDSSPTFHVKGDKRWLGWPFLLKMAKEHPSFHCGPIEVDEETIARWRKAEKAADKFYDEIEDVFEKEKRK